MTAISSEPEPINQKVGCKWDRPTMTTSQLPGPAQTVPGYKTATETSLILWATSPKWRNCKWPVRISKWSVVGINLTSQMENNSMVTLITVVTAGPSPNSGRSVTSTATQLPATFLGVTSLLLEKHFMHHLSSSFKCHFPWGRLLSLHKNSASVP